MPIHFHQTGVRYALRAKEDIAAWLNRVLRKEGFSTGDIAIILCSDEYLYRMNVDFLGHDYYTDIITFPLPSSGKKKLSGELYISIDRVRENAHELQISTREELLRVMVHGLLHLCGHSDLSKSRKAAMRKLEDFYLSLYL